MNRNVLQLLFLTSLATNYYKSTSIGPYKLSIFHIEKAYEYYIFPILFLKDAKHKEDSLIKKFTSSSNHVE